jgi:hypothetical protein
VLALIPAFAAAVGMPAEGTRRFAQLRRSLLELNEIIAQDQ